MTDSDRSMNLARDDWASVLRLLDEALDLPEPQREPWLAALDADLHRLQPALRQLLDQRRAIETGSFLKALPPLNDARSGDTDFAVGHRVGPYALLRELGHGGMASVWLAERADAAHGREVALKLPHLGARGRVLTERFDRERQILSALTHPHIASVLDAGADGAQPWLAMEYVDGRTITDWAAQQQLDIRARLRLFLQVLRAVQHAHAQLVIHRDIKPSNVLVATDGQVKLLDFGVAKLLGDDGASHETELTQLGGRAMTPQYASPEQVAGQVLGTASDVYSLGVLLYELLTGRLPYVLKRDTPAAVEEAILAAHILAPSAAVADKAASRALRGDVDTIVTKALAAQPADRYASAESMAQDIERHLQSLPILARPASAAYRLRKLVARNRLALGAGAMATMALLGGTGIALWQAERARQSADSARQEAARAEQTRDFLLGIMRAGDPAELGGRRPDQTTLAEVIARAEAQLDKLPAGDPALRRDMLFTLANVHSAMDHTDRTVALYEQVLALSREVDRTPTAFQAGVLSALTGSLMFGNQHAQAEVRNNELGALLAQLGDTSSIVYARHLRLRAMLMASKDSSHHEEVRDLLQRTAELFRRVGPDDPGRVGTLYGLARVQMHFGEVSLALKAADEALVAADLTARPQIERPNAHSLRASMRTSAGLLQAAREDYKAADVEYQRVLGADHFLTLQNEGALGEIQHVLGERDEGMRLMQSTLDMIASVRPGSSTHAYALDRIGQAHLRENRPREALAALQRAEQVWLARGGRDASRNSLAAQVDVLLQLGRRDDAAARLEDLKALNQARDGGKPDAATALGQGLLDIARDDRINARSALTQCLTLAAAPTRTQRWLRLRALQALVRLDLMASDAAGARSRVERAREVAAETALKEDPLAHQIAAELEATVTARR
jgi:eukaryotic-like serine/threonine-protein kinase